NPQAPPGVRRVRIRVSRQKDVYNRCSIYIIQSAYALLLLFRRPSFIGPQKVTKVCRES
ncbi:unnamed protein product, partial [Acanthoscelides obtectus]